MLVRCVLACIFLPLTRNLLLLQTDELLKGESDGSSFPNGGLRATHTAGGYTILDPSSPVFIRGDTIHIPTVFISWTGHALDEKTPLLRAEQALNKSAMRLLNALHYHVDGVQSNIGLEQEFFLIPRDAYARRLDLQVCFLLLPPLFVFVRVFVVVVCVLLSPSSLPPVLAEERVSSSSSSCFPLLLLYSPAPEFLVLLPLLALLLFLSPSSLNKTHSLPPLWQHKHHHPPLFSQLTRRRLLLLR